MGREEREEICRTARGKAAWRENERAGEKKEKEAHKTKAKEWQNQGQGRRE